MPLGQGALEKKVKLKFLNTFCKITDVSLDFLSVGVFYEKLP